MIEDLSGKQFNFLTVIKYDHKEVQGANDNHFWLCKCVCGKEMLVSRRALIRGRKSCGCMNKVAHVGSDYHGGVTTHGMSRTRFYKIYSKLRERCANNEDDAYKNISVCDRWKKFENFRDDMYESYQEHVDKFGEKNTSIDRIDVNGNYCKENCRWATLKEQANNKTNNFIIEFRGVEKTLSQWADYLGWSYCTLANRHHRGWKIDRMLTEPPKYQKVKKTSR